MDRKKLNIIISCVSSKKETPPDSLSFRNIPLSSIENMGNQWIHNLKTTPSSTTPAYQLYSGAAWNTVLKAFEVSQQLVDYDISWYIMSVGYGVIKWEQPIKPYSITFSKPSFDSVRKRQLKQSSNIEWWDFITKKRNLSLHTIIESGDINFIVGSTEYINAIRKDLSNSSNFYIISSIYNAQYFTENYIQTSEKLRFIVGGGKSDNNVRNLKYILENLNIWGDSLNSINTNLQNIISNISQELPKVKRNRKKITPNDAKEVLLDMGLDKPMSAYIHKFRHELEVKISEQVIIGYLQELKE